MHRPKKPCGSRKNSLALNLWGEGYTVSAVATGHEAIALGVYLRPQVLAADWMLLDHLHGLHVAAVLRAVHPQLRTVLITGFASQDLRVPAAQLPGCTFVAKPFRLDTFLQLLAQVVIAAPLPPAGLPMAVVEIDAAGRIAYANADAQRLFACTAGGQHARSMTEVVSRETMPDVEDTIGHWRAVEPRTPHQERWWVSIRAENREDRRLLALVPDDEDYALYDPVMRLLLNLPATTDLHWPLPGPTLIIDDDPVWRRLIANQLQRTGGVCHTTATLDEGLQLLRRHPASNVVILADNPPWHAHDDLAQFLSRAIASQPAVLLVGTRADAQRVQFATLGVPYFLRKPWGLPISFCC